MNTLQKKDNAKPWKQVRAHEFQRAESAFQFFISNVEMTFYKKAISTRLKFDLYNSYSFFIQHLYEFYLSFIEQQHQSERKNKDRFYLIVDSAINNEVNKLLRNYTARSDSGSSPIWANSRAYHEDTCPPDFGRDFRLVRNSLVHAYEGRLSGKKRILLSEFKNKYHRYIMLLFQSGRELWHIDSHNEQFDFGDIEIFAKEYKPTTGISRRLWQRFISFVSRRIEVSNHGA